MENIIIGKKPLYKFWSVVLKYASKQVEKRQKVELRFISIKFPSAHSCLIRFERVNTRDKFEYFSQGNFSHHYRESVNDSNYTPSDFNFEETIKKVYLQNQCYIINQ